MTTVIEILEGLGTFIVGVAGRFGIFLVAGLVLIVPALVGALKRAKYGVVGSPVNLTARIESGKGYPLHVAATLRKVAYDRFQADTVTLDYTLGASWVQEKVNLVLYLQNMNLQPDSSLPCFQGIASNLTYSAVTYMDTVTFCGQTCHSVMQPEFTAYQDGAHSPQGVATLVAALDGYRALLVGPGLTRQPATQGFVKGLFGPGGLSKDAWRGRVVADADCLNILSGLVAGTSVFAVARWLRSRSQTEEAQPAIDRDSVVEEADLESFPASDPPAWTGTTGSM